MVVNCNALDNGTVICDCIVWNDQTLLGPRYATFPHAHGSSAQGMASAHQVEGWWHTRIHERLHMHISLLLNVKIWY